MVEGGLLEGEWIELRGWRRPALVGRRLGAGGEGTVHEVSLDGVDTHRFAVKWYRPELATESQHETISQLALTGPPDDRFLWPLDIAASSHREGFGYVMPLRSPSLLGLASLLMGEVEPSWRVVARVGIELADALLQLHARGLCYRDINLGNAFFDPNSGSVAVCDCDNVGVTGVAPPRVYGTRGFMAPEVARGDAVPSTSTDRHSLAVLLFHLLVRHDPFVGRAELQFEVLDQEAVRYLWGDHPVFIFDPDDRSNVPVPGEHDNALAVWPLLPEFLRRLFIRTFTDGLRDPENGRVTESEWRSALARFRDRVRTCPACTAEQVAADGDDGPPCWACGAALPAPLRLRITCGTRVEDLVLESGVVLTPHHLGGERYRFETVIGEVTTKPDDPTQLGLTNRGTKAWQYESPRGARLVESGQTARLAPGVTFDFGGATASIASRT